MQAVRHTARIIAYLDLIGHRKSDSAHSLQMHACTCLTLESFPVRPIAGAASSLATAGIH